MGRWWHVWLEGYAVTGNSSDAQYCGEFKAETFADACATWVAALPSDPCYPNIDKLFDRERLTYWDCRFFDNEADARKTFG